jgi:two-component system, chemotaxis family, protein-glutamate methylesterase/glutaminase
LPGDLPATVLVVLHTTARAVSELPKVFASGTSLHVSHPQDGSPLEHGRVYIAAPDRHLLVEDSHATAVIGPKENLHRPAIDTLFRSAARRFGARVIGVVLTGMLDDGTAGMWEVKRHDGLSIIQDPKDAQYPQMPQSVLEHVAVDYCVAVNKIPSLLNSLCREDIYPVRKASSPAEFVMKAHDTHLTCPECGGPLQHLKYGKLNGFRCRTGHTFSTQSALTAHANAEEKCPVARGGRAGRGRGPGAGTCWFR